MKYLLFSLCLTMIFAVGAFGQTPPPKRVPHITKIHGIEMVDNYFWMREKSNQEVISFLEAENAATAAAMKSTEAFQETLYKEILGRIKQTDEDVPYRYGDHIYYSRTEEGKQYPILCRKKGTVDAPEQITLDVNELAKGQKFMSIGAYSISDDGSLLAYSTDNTGYRQYTMHIKDLRTGKTLSEDIPRVGSVVWANDNKTLFYSTEDDVTKRSDKIWKHQLGSDKSDLIFEEKDEIFGVGCARTRDRKIITITSYAKTSNEVRYIHADQPYAAFKLVLPRQEKHEYSVDHYNGNFYIVTNKDAVNSRIVSAPVDNPSVWTDFVKHNPAIKIEGTEFFEHHCVVSELEKGLQYLRVIDMRNKKSHRIKMQESLYTANVGINFEFNTNILRFNYQSMITPNSVFDYDMDKKTSVLRKQQPVLGGYESKNYETKRAWAVVRDGVKVPLSVVYRKGVKLNGKAPMLLYAYGSYGASMPPSFSSSRVSLLDRGVIFVIAHIRGGGELGEPWRESGRMMQKINTFNDFVDSAEWLIKKKYTSSSRLVVQGGSAGGLLMGAVVNMRPDLFKAVVAEVPFVDVMNTMLDASIPLTTAEYTEWGNPNIKAEFDYMIKYSPYDNVKPQAYPNMLVKVSLNDSQVPYWEGAKFAAKIREMKTDKNTVLLKTNMGAGHGGASGRYDALKEVAFNYAYMLQNMGVK